MSNIPIIDIIFFILIVLMVIHGYVKGFIDELFSWAAIVLAIFGAVFLYPVGAKFIRQHAFQNLKLISEILAFIAVFIIIMIVIRLLEHILKDVVTGARLGGVDKLLGAVFGLIEGVAITAIVLFILAVQPVFDSSKVLGDSLFAHLLLPLIQTHLIRGREVQNAVFLIVPGIRFLV